MLCSPCDAHWSYGGENEKYGSMIIVDWANFGIFEMKAADVVQGGIMKGWALRHQQFSALSVCMLQSLHDKPPQRLAQGHVHW